MADPLQLPALLSLLDDPSPVVQAAVRDQLAAWGPGLKDRLARHHEDLTPARRRRLDELLAPYARAWLHESWAAALARRGDRERLEAGLAVLADHLNGPGDPRRLAPLLDRLAEEMLAREPVPTVTGLVRFLFREKGLAGERDDYYHPRNSNLVEVILRRRGNPISLACVLILVGHRLGIPVHGCNLPGHFYARVRVDGREQLVDCFHRGRFLAADDLFRGRRRLPAQLARLLREEPPAEVILARVLRNLVGGFQRSRQPRQARWMMELLVRLRAGSLGSAGGLA